MSTIKTIIADDEPNARRRIQRLLEEHEEFEIIKSSKNGKETLNDIRKLEPDLVFLDIQMPVYNGFELLELLDPDDLPEIVFITAYDEFALRAFEVHAIDYLMKPFDKKRFEAALEKVKKSVRAPADSGTQHSIPELLKTIRNESTRSDRIMIKDDGKFFFLDTSQIEWIESAGNYIKIVCKDDQYMVRETMKNIEAKLNAKTFFRIHRSTIINIQKVKVIEPWFHGDYQVTMNNGKQLNMSRNYKKLLEVF